MAGGVFISYRREDSRHAAGRLFDHLKRALPQRRLFMDVDSIAPGRDFVQILDESLESCESMLVIIGHSWASPRLHDPDDFVRREIETAISRRISVFPILVDGARMPLPNELPDSLKLLPRQQAISISHDQFGQGITRIVEALEDRVKPEHPDTAPSIEEIPQAELQRMLDEFERVAKTDRLALYAILDRDKTAADIIARVGESRGHHSAPGVLSNWAWDKIRIIEDKAARGRAIRSAIKKKYLQWDSSVFDSADRELFSLTYYLPHGLFYRGSAWFSLLLVAILLTLWVNVAMRVFIPNYYFSIPISIFWDKVKFDLFTTVALVYSSWWLVPDGDFEPNPEITVPGGILVVFLLQLIVSFVWSWFA